MKLNFWYVEDVNNFRRVLKNDEIQYKFRSLSYQRIYDALIKNI